jgi:hypothetical protein
MKKLIFTIVVLTTLSILTQAQIPNYDFENWNSNITSRPQGWLSYGKTSQVNPGINGNFAIRIERDSVYSDAPGAIVYGTPSGNSVKGGIPFTGRPDSLVGFFKYHIVTDDSAWIYVVLKLNGVPVSNDSGYLIGTDTSEYQRIALKLHYFSGETPDSLILAVTSTNPNGQVKGSYVIVDSLHFINTTLKIPNGDFESWKNDTNEEPVDWYTSNRYYIPNPTLPVSKTTDSYSGSYAIRIENVNYINGLANAFAFAGPQGNNGPRPGFPVSERKLFLEGYYKYFPKNGDEVNLGVIMYYQGNEVGWGFLQSSTPRSSYTYFATPVYFSYDFIGIPDSATIILMPYSGGQMPKGNSVLIVDSIGFRQERLEQAITFGNLPAKSTDDLPFELYAYSSSGLQVTYTSSNSNVAVIDGITVSILGEGTTEITAMQEGNDYYNAAEAVTQILTVLPGTAVGTASSEMLKVYPSPASDKLYVQSSELISEVSIYNLLGSRLTQCQFRNSSGNIDVSQLSRGLYFVKIQCGGKEYIKKIEKK